ncbi:hypothetical protein ABT332_06635 [Saccharomonospora azurea]|uniref:hypothetical protein n=1 Tax=Saccharomonospora azurea TaxID=40988 RepID=UPI003327CDDE
MIPRATREHPNASSIDIRLPFGKVGEEVARIDPEQCYAIASCLDVGLDLGGIITIDGDVMEAECGPDGMRSAWVGGRLTVGGREIDIPVNAPPNTGIELMFPTPGPVPDIKIGELTLNKQVDGRVSLLYLELLEGVPISPISGTLELIMASCCNHDQ